MEETIDNNFSDTQDVLNILFSQSSKMNLLDKLYRNLVALNLGDAYNNLYNKLGDLFNDKTNGKKYFNNLVNILEILDWAQTKYYDFNDNYFQILWNKFKSSDKINDFINLVKSFEATDSEYMFVVKGENGNEFKTPGLQITRAHILFDNDEVIIASDISNTCKTGSTIKDQFDKLGLDPYDDAVNDSLNKYQRNYLTTAQKLNRDVFGVGSSAITFLLALKKIKDQYEWETKILDDYDLTLQDLKNLVEEIKGYHIYNTARLLSKPEDDKILFYNVPIRGKGNGDFNHIDSEEFELFSMFDKDSMFKLNRYHLGRNDNWNGILHFSKYGANFLFDKVSYDQDKGKGEEGYEAKTSLLTDLGKKITKTGLKWFLDENEYEITDYEITDEDGNISVEKKVKAKHIEKDINIIGINDDVFPENKEISDQEIFNQISNVEKDIDHEVEDYANKFIEDVKNLFEIYFAQYQMLPRYEINTHSSNYNNAGAVNQEIDSKINQFINDFCDAYKNGLVKIWHSNVEMKDQCNFEYLIKKVIAPLLTNYFKNLPDKEKENLASGVKSIIKTIEDKFGNELLNKEKIRDKLVCEIYYNESDWENPVKTIQTTKQIKCKDTNGKPITRNISQVEYVADNFKFSFDAADLAAHKTAKLLNESFNKFKEQIGKVFNNVLPDNKEKFEKSFEDVDCAEFVTFLKQNMHIDVNKEFLKKAISAMFYTWVESVHGNADNGDQKLVKERMTAMRAEFFESYSGTKFIHEVKLYTSSVIDKGEKPLPDAFYCYNSDTMDMGDGDSPAYRFTVVNYIQAFYYATLVVKRKKFKNISWWLRWWSHRRFNKNIKETRRILQTGTEAERTQIFNRMRQIRNQNYKDNIWGLPLAFLDILLDGVSIDLNLQEKIEICTFARNYVNYELDNETKEHVTKSNFMEIDKKNNCYLKSGGEVVLPLVNLFAPGAIDEFLSQIICDQVWEESFCNACCGTLSDSWHYFDQNNIFIKLLAKALFILLFTCFSLIIGIVLLIAYIVYTKNLKNKLNELANDPTFNKLRQAEINGREEYNELQNFRQNAKKEKPPTIIENGKQKINLSIGMNQKLNIIDNINDEDNINNNLIDNNIINTNSNQINDLFNNY